ncbi:fibrinogen-like protein 1 isoform X2 [Branchiostoma floridae]|uniref:Fibrinogen-like protein 1 isoform X2 n=1 Tax=Branchiostoma floridae TaxID=7739 RepID=A0A9J7KM90_BRAFL|nr:fibrinogen-like protein 1 isoform X2 [Branchiostoma floridae]
MVRTLLFSLMTVVLLVGGGWGDVTFSAEISQQDAQEDRLNHHVDVKAQRNDPLPGTPTFEDCAALYPHLSAISTTQNGVFYIKPQSVPDQFEVYCDVTTDGGGWTAIQRRFDGRVNFNRNWADYKNGFGRVTGEHWLGLDKIHALTTQGSYELYVEVGDWEGNFAYAIYDTFSIGDEGTEYRLDIGGYSGDAGDSMSDSDGRRFSARDVDNDAMLATDCAQRNSAGWWYYRCADSTLNGPYYQLDDYNGQDTGRGVFWQHWKGYWYSLKTTKMMVRPRNFKRNL